MPTIGYDLTGAFQPAGISVYARELVRHIAKIEGHPDLAFLVHDTQIDQVHQWMHGALRYEVYGVLPSERRFGHIGRRLARHLVHREWKKLANKFDLVHFHEGGRALPPVRPYVVTVHDLFPLDPLIPCPPALRSSFKRKVLKTMLYGERILVPSDFVGREITTQFPEYASKIRVTHLAASNAFVPSTLPHPLGGRPYVVWIGRNDERKNLVRILHAWRQMPMDVRKASTFVMICKWDPTGWASKDHEIRALFEAGEIRVVAANSQEEHNQLLTHAAGLIFPSIAEGFGLPVIEAMKCGCPVLTSSTSSLPEVAGDAALVVDPYDVEAISRGTATLLTDAARRDDLRTKGFAQADLFSWQNTAQRTLDVYREVLA